MKQKQYTRPCVTNIKLHDLCQITVISGVADEDSLGRRLEDQDHTNNDYWQDSPEKVSLVNTPPCGRTIAQQHLKTNASATTAQKLLS